MEFTISLKDLHFYAYHGVMAEERVLGNEFVVNLSVILPVNEDKISDDIEHTISYADLYAIVKEEMASPVNLLETLALKIEKKVRKAYPKIKGGTVSIEKLHPPIPDIHGSACVSLKF